MSNFVVSARKYRPKTFDEVVGQSHVSDTLKKALQGSKIAHAYLFCGPRGVGKTTCARILAKVVNCENPIDQHTPCGTCNSCRTFEENSSFNIIELDAASNNSVENIRSLIEQVRIQPQSGSYKIFIIDEVHMLSQAAFNAFLKTLEEPPSYVIFIMATTEKHKILPTILSRCQIYDFKRIQPSDIVPQLEHILVQEEKTADPEALHIIGQKADGAMRDALSIFDRIASSSGDHISYKDVVSNLNILDYDYFFKVTDNLMLERLGDTMLILDEILHNGFEADQFIHGLSDHFRNLLMLSQPETVQLLDVGENLKERYLAQAGIIRKDTLMSFLNIANMCDIQYPTAKNKRLHVEIALSKMSYAARLLQTGSLNLKEKKTEVANETSVSSPISTNISESKTADQEASKKSITEKKKEDPKIANKEDQSKSEQNDTDALDDNPLSEEVLSKESKQKENSAIPKSRVELLNNPMKITSLGGINMPVVSSNSIDSIEEEIRKEEQSKKENQIPITAEAVKELVTKYATSIDSNSIKQVLNQAEIEIDDKIVKFLVPSVIAKESVVQQDALMDQIRDYFGQRDLAVPVIIDADRFPDYVPPKVNSALSDKDKFLKLSEKNPLLLELQKKFDLQPD